MHRFDRITLAVLLLCVVQFTGCQHVVIDVERLLKTQQGAIRDRWLSSRAWNDLRRVSRLAGDAGGRSSEGMNPHMGAIMGAFQILWIYYGLCGVVLRDHFREHLIRCQASSRMRRQSSAGASGRIFL